MRLKNVTSKDRLVCCYKWQLGHDNKNAEKVFGTPLPGQCQTSVGWSRTVKRKRRTML